jgi:GT2 family glycosyltransferase/cyclopropane fatty-acyl-phospholipid synthase-like methyltransferase
MIVIVVCHNQLEYTKGFVESVNKASDSLEGVKIVMVNNGSDKDTAEYLFGLKTPYVYWENSENKFFTEANKEVIDAYPDEDIYLINNDVVVLDGWLSGIKEVGKWGAIGATQLHPLNCGFITFGGGLGNFAGHKAYFEWEENGLPEIHEEKWLTGCGMMINRKAYDLVGGFDTSLRFYCQDSDLSLRLRNAGFKVGVSKSARIIHYGGLTTRSLGQDNPFVRQGMKDQQLFAMKHKVKCGQFDYRVIDGAFFDEAYFEKEGEKNGLSGYFEKQSKEAVVVAGRWINECDIKEGNTVLEIGCAYGQVVGELRKRGVLAYGVDVSEYSIGRGIKEVDKNLAVCDITKEDFVLQLKTAFGISQFDFVCSAITFEHFKPSVLPVVFKNLRAISKTGTYHFHEIDLIQGNDETHFSIFPREQWDAIFKYNGFKVIEPNDKDLKFNWFRSVMRDMSKVDEFYNDYFDNDGMFIRNCEVSIPVAETLFNKFDLKDKRVLELGCAYGQVVKNLNLMGAKAIGLDVSETAIHKGGVAECRTCNFADVPLTGIYDFIFSKAVLEHIPESKTDFLLQNIYDCLDDGGVTEHEIDTEAGQDASHINIVPIEDWITRFEKAGFKSYSYTKLHGGMYDVIFKKGA